MLNKVNPQMFPVTDLCASTVSVDVANIGELSCVSVLIDLNNLHKNIKKSDWL